MSTFEAHGCHYLSELCSCPATCPRKALYLRWSDTANTTPRPWTDTYAKSSSTTLPPALPNQVSVRTATTKQAALMLVHTYSRMPEVWLRSLEVTCSRKRYLIDVGMRPATTLPPRSFFEIGYLCEHGQLRFRVRGACLSWEMVSYEIIIIATSWVSS